MAKPKKILRGVGIVFLVLAVFGWVYLDGLPCVNTGLTR